MKSRNWFIHFIIALFGLFGTLTASADHFRVVNGVEIYLGLIPLAMVMEDTDMHGGAPRKEGQYHLTVALFDADSGARIEKAKAAAEVSPVGLENSKYKKLEPMVIAGTVTFGEYFELDLHTVYHINLRVDLPDRREPVTAMFEYDHRAHD